MTTPITISSVGKPVNGWPSRLRVTYDDRRTRRYFITLPGAVGSTNFEHVTLPPEPLTVEKILAHFGRSSVELTDDVDRWYVLHGVHNRQLFRIQGQDDAEEHPEHPWESRLYPYQRVGAAWLYNVGRGMLGDEPGLGKTIQALTAAADSASTLIVTLNSVKDHWAYHLRDWLHVPESDISICEGDHAARQAELDKKRPWVIVNHDMMKPGPMGYKRLRDRAWDTVIIDEAHLFQGRQSQRSVGAEQLRTNNLYLLTGTPVWNAPESLWHLLKLMYPARFSSYWRFIEEYYDIEQTPWGTKVLGVNQQCLDALRGILAPILLRRTKYQVLPSLPNKVRESIYWVPNSEQLAAHRLLLAKLSLQTQSETIYYPSVATALSDSRELLNAPQLVGTNLKSPKDKVIQELVDTLLDAKSDRKILIFTWHVEYAKYLGELLWDWGTVVITGDTVNSNVIRENFRRDPRQHILVGTISSVGTGVDLIEATAAIFAEGSYVPTLNLQAEDRLHRIGQKTDVTIYRVMARGTIEEAIWNVSDEREDMATELLSLETVVDKAIQLATKATVVVH